MSLRKITLALLFAAGLFSGVALFDATFRHQVMGWLTPLNTILLFIFAFLHGYQRYGWKRILLMFIVVTTVSLAMESYGVATGKIYGGYHYSDLLGPKFLGLVPYLIPVAWFMMMYASYLIADLVIPGQGSISRALLVAAVAGLTMTAWDLAMDPMMVGGGHWIWDTPGAYFGIPLQNFFGWWLTTFSAVAIYMILSEFFFRQPVDTKAVPANWAIFAYTITAVSTIWVDLVFGLTGPAMVGIFAMSPWIIAGFITAWRLEPLPNAN